MAGFFCLGFSPALSLPSLGKQLKAVPAANCATKVWEGSDQGSRAQEHYCGRLLGTDRQAADNTMVGL